MGKITLLNCDCMKYMKTCKDNEFDLAIVDPPYFNGPEKDNFYRNGLFSSTNAPAGKYKSIDNWQVPDEFYFKELLRVSKNQIVWGINYYAKFIDSVGRIVWDKENGTSSFSDGEIASCSLIKSVRFYRYRWNGMLQGDMKNKEKRIHPTQKPVKLYQWLLKNYAKEGDRILDTHGGSMSSMIACYYGGFDAVCCELNLYYFNSGKERLKDHQKQLLMF